LLVLIAINPRITAMKFKSRCCFHDNVDIIPPQLHGISVLRVKMYKMYIIKIIIMAIDALNPFNRHFGKKRRIEIRISVNGNKYVIKGAMGSNIEDDICSLNNSKSNILLIPVYRNSIIKRYDIACGKRFLFNILSVYDLFVSNAI
jgi:hypothetical protein